MTTDLALTLLLWQAGIPALKKSFLIMRHVGIVPNHQKKLFLGGELDNQMFFFFFFH